MAYDFGNDKKSAFQAQFDAQKIAYAPIMFQAARALRNLGILKVVKEHREGITIEDVAKELNLQVYGVKVLLEAGLSIELVYAKDHKYFITKTGWFIMNDKLTQVNMDFNHDVNYKGFFHLEEAIKTGKPEGLKVFGEWSTVYEALSGLPQQVRKSWFGFDHYYSDDSFPQALPIVFKDNPSKIMDVGGNTGKFAIKCAEYNPNVKITILDLPGQLSEALQNAKDKGYDDRIDGVAIDLLDHNIKYPKNYNVVWMSQFLDCFSQEDIVQLLIKAKAALTPKGAIYIMETFWDNQITDAGRYCLVGTSLYFTCIANGCSQMYHTEDMTALIEKAGLKIDETYNKIGVSHTILKCVSQG